MKKKGFTLIEVLVVIVILVIIALIAMPIVENVRKKTAESSVLGYVDAVEKQLITNEIASIGDGIYDVPLASTYGVSIKEEAPKSGWIEILGNKVTRYSLVLIDDYVVSYDGIERTTEKGMNAKEKPESDVVVKNGPMKEEAKVGETHKGIVYLDPTDLTKTCTKELAEQNVNENGTPTEIKTGCMKWYIFEDSEDTYTMLLDHNTTAMVDWHDSDYSVTYENSNVKTAVDELVTTYGWKVIPRLITAEEVATIVGVSTFESSNENTWFYFEGTGDKKQTNPTYDASNKSKYGWLYNNLGACAGVLADEDGSYASLNWGCTIADDNIYEKYGQTKRDYITSYWTSTLNSTSTWEVLFDGSLKAHPPMLGDDASTGIRPVITIAKSKVF